MNYIMIVDVNFDDQFSICNEYVLKHVFPLFKKKLEKMLKFLSQVYIGSDKESLEKLADTVAADALKKTNEMRKKNVKTLNYSSTLTLFETAKFISNFFEFTPKSIWRSSLSVLFSSLSFYQNYQPEILAKLLFNEVVYSFPVVNILEEAFSYAGVPPKLLTYSIYGFFSLGQVLSLRLMHGFSSKSLVNILSSAAAITLIHYGSYCQVRALHDYFGFIQPPFLALPIVYLTRDIVQRIAIFGISNTFNYLVELAASTWIKFRHPGKPDPVPVDFEIPQSMTCPICHEMLVNPVESLGFFFCEDCLYKWVNGNNTHPSTGEPISYENINKSVEMTAIITQYRKIMNI